MITGNAHALYKEVIGNLPATGTSCIYAKVKTFLYFCPRVHTSWGSSKKNVLCWCSSHIVPRASTNMKLEMPVAEMRLLTWNTICTVCLRSTNHFIFWFPCLLINLFKLEVMAKRRTLFEDECLSPKFEWDMYMSQCTNTVTRVRTWTVTIWSEASTETTIPYATQSQFC